MAKQQNCNETPTFSVVIPTYNHAEFIETALMSVLGQTYQNFEIVIVNNYSTDDTLKIIEQIGDDRIKVINFKNDGVIAASRNIGIKSSHGDYIAFLDSDDSWYPTKLQDVIDSIGADPEVGLICHNLDLVRDGHPAGTARLGPPKSFQGTLYDYQLLHGSCVSTSATVVGRQHIEQVGYFSEDTAIVTVEDYDLWLRLSKVCRFKFITKVLGVHQYHVAGASTNVEKHLNATLAVLNKHFNGRSDFHRPVMKRALRSRSSNAYYGAARQYHRSGNFLQAIGYYVRALVKYPLLFRAYAGLGLLVIDRLIGQARLRKGIRAIRPTSWPGTWLFA